MLKNSSSLKSEIPFSKFEGAGNDFILIDDRASFFPVKDSCLIRRLCHRRFGIGADGLILLQQDAIADIRMRIFNCDGREAGGCGNGVRCLMRFCEEVGLPRKKMRIAVGSRVLEADFDGDLILIDMGVVSDWKTHAIDGREIHFVDSGVPHAVWFVSDVEPIPHHEIGPVLRNHPAFLPCGANVNIAAKDPAGRVRVRTFERGVEAETLACGTGATAVAALGAWLYGWDSPVRISCAGGDLDVHFDDSRKTFRMAGPAHRLFRGVF